MRFWLMRIFPGPKSPVVPFFRGREGDGTFNGFVLSNFKTRDFSPLIERVLAGVSFLVCTKLHNEGAGSQIKYEAYQGLCQQTFHFVVHTAHFQDLMLKLLSCFYTIEIRLAKNLVQLCSCCLHTQKYRKSPLLYILRFLNSSQIQVKNF